MVLMKLVAVGDQASGKGKLLYTFIHDKYPEQDEHNALVSGDHKKTITHHGTEVVLGVFDTVNMEYEEGKEEDTNFEYRSLFYPYTDVFLVCFSVMSPPPFDVIKEMWVPEIQLSGWDVPFLLVGTETDLRQDALTHTEEGASVKDTAARAITPEKGKELAKEVGAADYVECSARTQEGVKEVFDKAVKFALKRRRKIQKLHRRRVFCTLV